MLQKGTGKYKHVHISPCQKSTITGILLQRNKKKKKHSEFPLCTVYSMSLLWHKYFSPCSNLANNLQSEVRWLDVSVIGKSSFNAPWGSMLNRTDTSVT